MKDSGIEWLGEIPGHWELKPLKHVAHINLEKLEENTDPDYEFKYVDIGNVSFGQINGLPYIMKFKDAPSRARRIIRKGNTILSTVRTYLKSITFIDESLDGQVASTGFAIISAKSKLIDKYLFFITSSNVFIETVCSISVGVSYPATNAVDISQIKVWIPSISEQTAIVHYIENEMSRINNVGDKIKKEIDLIKEYKTSLINEAVTGKIDVRDYRLEESIEI